MTKLARTFSSRRRVFSILGAISVAVLVLPMAVTALVRPKTALPAQIDVHGANGVPVGLSVLQLSTAQSRALQVLKSRTSQNLRVEYNGLTATPRELVNLSGYLTGRSTDAPQKVALSFLRENSELYRFSTEDLQGLQLLSQTTLTDTGTTVMLFQQHIGGVPVFQGGVLVNVSKGGRVISAGNESYPQMNVTNQISLSPGAAVNAIANSFGLSYAATPVASTKVLKAYGQLPAAYVDAPTFAGNGVFSRDIAVTPTIYPLGATGRYAYEFIVVTPKFQGVMWQCVVDAQTGEVLRRVSLTHFVSTQPGGGVGKGRRATFRPDVEDLVENLNNPQTAAGMIFDTHPVTLSAVGGTGRAVRSGTAPDYTYMSPTYDAEATLSNHYRYSLVQARNEEGLPFGNGTPKDSFTQAGPPEILGQVLRGLPDATHPSASSPMGWFYLPTDQAGAEFTDGNPDHAGTRAFGYVMDSNAVTRNQVNPANSPAGDGTQPFSASITTLPGPVTLADGRVLGRVFESQYTEGNNVFVSDDRANDDDATLGIRGYSSNRQFTAPYFDFVNSYEFGGMDATSSNTGATGYPATADPDVFPDTVSLFFGNNIEHDYLYSIGFTEANWNFQQDNFGKGGAGADAVSAQVQDGSGTDNANFGTPADGSRPTMQMYLFTDGGLRRSDGAFDWDVFAHEYYHGVSTRSSGKGSAGCLVAGIGLTGEAGGQGEGWSDTIASSLSDDDNEGEYVTGEFDVGIRHMPYSNYRWSYGSLNGTVRNVRELNGAVAAPDGAPGSIPFEVHDVGEVWASTLWDMRELFINKDPGGVFFDKGRTGNGTGYYLGDNLVKSVDGAHPIDYRASFADTSTDPSNLVLGIAPSYVAGQAVVRPGLIAAEIKQRGDRHGPIATAVMKGGRLADTLVLRGLQLGLCQPSMVDSRDSILMADSELTGGENRALIWRAFASHGIGVNAASTSSADSSGTAGAAPVTVEDFTVPTDVATCESSGPLKPPPFTLSNTKANTVTVTINGGAAVTGANEYIISRATSANGPFSTIATIAAATTSYDDKNLSLNQTYYYEVRTSRDANADCVSQFNVANAESITLSVGTVATPAPVFAGVNLVDDPAQCSVLNLSWLPASSTSASADIVYDVYRVSGIAAGDGTTLPTFTPAPANQVKKDLTTTSFSDTGLMRNTIYYYIVQARDRSTGQIDTNNAGNAVVQFNAPSSRATGTAAFALEDYEASSADNRFTPPLMDETAPQIALPVWQRVAGADLGGGQTSTVMYAPDLDPTNGGVTVPIVGLGVNGAQSDFSTMFGPITLTADSVMEFDSRIQAENTFDGGVVELAFTPVFNATPTPDDTTTFDLGQYMVSGGYTGALDGPPVAGPGYGNLIGPRRAFTGTRGLKHTRIPLSDFAPGGVNNANGQTVYIRFRMTSDILSNLGSTSGWYVDNLVINTESSCPVNNPPIAVLKVTPSSGKAPLNVTLDGSGSSDPDTDDRVKTFTFDFGDGGSPVTQDSATVTHSYKKGDYTATLTVADNSGLASTPVTQMITVQNNPPVAAITANPTTQTKGRSVSFDASTSSDADGDSITQYTFDFGDGSATMTQATATVSHTYSTSGKYSATVSVNDGTDESASPASVDVTITDTAPTASLSATSATTGNAPLTVSFDASGSSDPDAGDSVQSYHFDYGDGNSEDKVQPSASHTYSTTGNYTVTLVVYDDENVVSSNTAMLMVTANAAAAANTAPTASLSATPTSGTAPLMVMFDGSKSSDPDAGDSISQYQFDFGDGSAVVSQSGATISHSYTSAGAYTATLTVTDSHGLASSNSSTVKITVNAATTPNTAPTASVTATPTSGSSPLRVAFDGSHSSDPDSGDTVASYTFNFGDGSATVTQSSATIYHTYMAAGSYTATLTVADSHGLTSSNTAMVTITVTAAASDTAPTASLSADPMSGTSPLTVNLDGSASSDPDSGDVINAYTFNFGDGSATVTQSSSKVTHVYGNVGSYVVSLTVTDSHGESSTNTASETITVVAKEERPRGDGGAFGETGLLVLAAIVGLRRRRSARRNARIVR